MVSLWVASCADYLLGVARDRLAYHFFRANGDRFVLAVEELGESDELLMAIQEEDCEHRAWLGNKAQLHEAEQQVWVAEDLYAAAEMVREESGGALNNGVGVGWRERLASVDDVAAAIG